MRILGLGIAMLTLLAACGNTDTERAATGAVTGGTAGAVVGGPAGALVGGAAGAAGGTMLDESVMDKVDLEDGITDDIDQAVD